ncbi:MFS transporter [Bifidobacterium tibiigranuli]|jgi:putative MFS transporter|uniref:MFS transporter n=1 Tax=Bifidobacterium tibiigranuli TaxID=2172043 RepID=UPI0026ED6250|nr:MFS transporter [Bifidobacterium tibiigranuli]MCI1223412.1 sugar porter family MFS transporter [Bifidobacterium subtile]MCI1650249.1 sugar porter family MFS transporter [Bifidobacterium tibiigranuli]MCI2184827.1 sugar porter family MFS transporter [Bifidobacterium tibiigranuli]MCI2204382.1 sugar porter family MFS transporter [Bifidobacterium tibiigranuli]
MNFDSFDNPKTKRFQRKVTLLSAGGSFLDGYDLTVIAVAMPLFADEWGINAWQKSLVTSAAIFGSFIGAVLLGNLTDRFGRKAMYIVDLLAFVVFAVLTAFSPNVWFLIVFRFLLGLGIGADYPISSTLVAEFAPKKGRGKLSTSLGVMWFVGAVAAYLVGLAVMPMGDYAWRAMLLVGAVFALVVFFFRINLPESPRWLIAHGRTKEALDVVENVTGERPATIDMSTEPAAERAPLSLLFRGAQRNRTLFVCGFWFCYSTAYYGISMYTPTIIAPFTHGNHTLVILASGVVAVLGLIGSLIGMNIVDIWGRRPLIITSFTGLTVALTVLAAVTNPSLEFLIVLFSIAVLFSNSGGGVLNFVYPTELFPTALRATGSGLATSVSRIGSILGVVAFPNMVAAWGNNAALWVFAAVGLTGTLICVFMAPETKGRGLEEISADAHAPAAAGIGTEQAYA